MVRGELGSGVPPNGGVLQSGATGSVSAVAGGGEPGGGQDMSILDHLSEDQIVDLLGQHNNYGLGPAGMSVSRRSRCDRWFVYYLAEEVHCRFEKATEPVGYIDLCDALDVALNQANWERWGIA
jgi:hypothetical protein